MDPSQWGGRIGVVSLNNQAVYPTVQDIPDPSQGVKVQFTSAKRSETYPLGTYSGTYEVIVTPSV